VRSQPGWAGIELIEQALQVGRLVDVVPLSHRVNSQPKGLRALGGLAVHTRRTPLDVLENSEMRLPHRDQVIPAVSARSQAQISCLLDCLAGFDDRLGLKSRVVAADQHHGVEPGSEVMLEGERQRLAETAAWLLEQAHLAGEDDREGRTRAARVDHSCALPAELESELHRVQKKAAIQVGGRLSGERWHQASLGPACFGRLAYDDQGAPHPPQRNTGPPLQS
jgi:hypothetical protein